MNVISGLMFLFFLQALLKANYPKTLGQWNSVCVWILVSVDSLIIVQWELIILAVMGLGAMYMMHLLAQDYDRIRRPITKVIQRALFRGKRDVDILENNEVVNISVDWKSLLDNDPLSCLQSLICQIVSGAQANNTEADVLRQFIKFNFQNAPTAVTSAYAKGLAFRGFTESCYSEYPFCWYSAKTMLTILRWFA